MFFLLNICRNLSFWCGAACVTERVRTVPHRGNSASHGNVCNLNSPWVQFPMSPIQVLPLQVTYHVSWVRLQRMAAVSPCRRICVLRGAARSGHPVPAVRAGGGRAGLASGQQDFRIKVRGPAPPPTHTHLPLAEQHGLMFVDFGSCLWTRSRGYNRRNQEARGTNKGSATRTLKTTAWH